MNNQEAFAIVKKHLLCQRQRCVGDDGTCRLRANGLKCALGALLPDDKYHPDLEISFMARDFPGVDVWLQDAMRYLHDVRNVEDWGAALDILEERVHAYDARRNSKSL